MNTDRLTHSQDKISYVIFVLLILIGVFSLLMITRNGIGISPDSVTYLGAAQNLVNGDGLTIPYGVADNPPMTHHAPLYPALVAFLGALSDLELMQVARLVNILLFASNLALLYWILRTLLPDQLWLPLVGVVVMMVSPTILRIHTMVWSEPLFLFLTLLGLYLLSVFLSQSGKIYLLSISGIVLGLAFLTRYAGVVFVVVGAVSIMLLSREPLRIKLRDLLIFCCLSALPSGLWLMRNSIQAGTATSRDILFHPIGKAQIIQLVDTFSNWMLVPTWIPTSFRTIFLLGFLLLVVVVLTIVLRSSGADDRKENILILWGWIPELIKIVILFILLYLLFLVISISFVDANTPLDERILSPVFVAGLIIIVYAFGRLLTAESTHRYVKYLIVTLLLVFSVVNVMNISDWIKVRQTAGMGFSNSRWKDSGAIAWLNELPSGETVYTNAPEVVYLYTPHLALRLPVEQFSVTGQDNLNYREDLHVVKSQLIQSDGYVLYFPLPGYTTQADETRLVEDLGLCLITKTANGNLYHLSEPGEPCQF